MRIPQRWIGISLTISVFSLLIVTFNGCGGVGPAHLKAGIGLYNEAVNSTDAQQTLLTIVRNRYGEDSTILAVASVTANIRVSTNADINVGIGSDANYAGNLVPFNAGLRCNPNPFARGFGEYPLSLYNPHTARKDRN